MDYRKCRARLRILTQLWASRGPRVFSCSLQQDNSLPHGNTGLLVAGICLIFSRLKPDWCSVTAKILFQIKLIKHRPAQTHGGRINKIMNTGKVAHLGPFFGAELPQLLPLGLQEKGDGGKTRVYFIGR
jgi:hypothetical protein